MIRNMCDVFDRYEEKGKLEGRIEGRIDTLLEQGVPAEKVAEKISPLVSDFAQKSVNRELLREAEILLEEGVSEDIIIRATRFNEEDINRIRETTDKSC